MLTNVNQSRSRMVAYLCLVASVLSGCGATKAPASEDGYWRANM